MILTARYAVLRGAPTTFTASRPIQRCTSTLVAAAVTKPRCAVRSSSIRYNPSRIHQNLQQKYQYQYNIIIAPQLGSVTHFSSFFGGGGGKKPPSFDSVTKSAGAIGAASILLFGKAKYLLGALKLTKFASLGSMLVSIGTYSIFFGLPYAAGMVGLILVHEAGHALVMVNRGIPFSPALFIPFMGAAIVMKEHPRDAWEDALVAFGGPILGSVGAGAVAVAAASTESQLLYALADFGYMINLFNLLPIGSMDGGRITGALSPYAGVVGLGIGGTMAYAGAIHNPIMYIVLLAGGYQTYQRFFDPLSTPPNYYNISTSQRVILTGGYFGLIGALVLAQDYNSRYRKPPQQLEAEARGEPYWDMS